MLRLYDYLPSQNAWKIRVLFHLLGVPYTTQEISIFEGAGQTDAFLKLNPSGAVPALELEDGRALSESNAILQFLADGTDFLPSDRFGRAKVAQWLSFEQYYIESVIGSLRFWTLTGRLKRNAAMVPAKQETATKALRALDRSLADATFLVGDRLSIADISVYAYTHLAGDVGIDLPAYPALAAWLSRVAAEIGPNNPVHPYTIDPHAIVRD
ncbi:glutathione S-transferase family protein [Paraburkholderia sp. CNPSo 3281]|uniref:glutathione S-transferase family protein n=1 Tax=Paraburkholderia sp. CNPSo 3281 TaxID=2940933 RepID=UPI0020B72DBE|nr:glutathione S-transferase family protein [Paraburkholderia sp. CNPSo 3281]MCP3716239.1 glutathione S-transferase family protein [Paraburkholderia sp. CNPSo 3281]